jgi:hypothetical protein
MAERRVERGRLAGPGRAGDEDQAVGPHQALAQSGHRLVVVAKLVE